MFPQISVRPDPEDPSPPTPLAETPGEPRQSPPTDPRPQTEPAPSSPHPEPSPAPRRSPLDPLTQTAARHTPGPGPRVLQKGAVARNLSGGGEAGPAGGKGQGKGETEAPGGGRAQRSALEVGVLLGCSAGLGMVLAVGLRYLHSQYCLKRTAVSLNEHDGGGIIRVQDSGELVQIRKIRQNSFVLLQAEYNVMSPPGN